ncbi:uncharacterized protein LOC117913002 [Vitis riparia]|uniref:uncharacterized protein LOC117913002 n=1 Tax=Vitis riparia TaxID=96939 RepID=UPI00155A73B7|nr:uncharacterized protein LOC117913002 [Vitis riparia]
MRLGFFQFSSVVLGCSTSAAAASISIFSSLDETGVSSTGASDFSTSGSFCSVDETGVSSTGILDFSTSGSVCSVDETRASSTAVSDFSTLSFFSHSLVGFLTLVLVLLPQMLPYLLLYLNPPHLHSVHKAVQNSNTRTEQSAIERLKKDINHSTILHH